MKITRQFKDYYDGLQAQGQDDGLVFVREPIEYQMELNDWPRPGQPNTDKIKVPAWLMGCMGRTEFPLDYQHIPKSRNTWNFSAVRVMFCGKLYTGVSVHGWGTSIHLTHDPLSPDRVIWSADVFFKWAKEHHIDLEKKELSFDHRNHNVPMDKRIKDFFKVRSVMQTATEQRVAIVVSETVFRTIHFTVNGVLSRHQFQQVMPPAQAYQELTMFLGNFAPENKPMAEVSEKDRVQQHGFDKWSFRKKGENSV